MFAAVFSFGEPDMKNVTFDLGPAPAVLNSRTITIRRVPIAGDDTIPVTAEVNGVDVGVTQFTTQALPSNQMWEMTLVDTLDGGEVSAQDVLHFHTGTLQFPGPRSGDRLSIIGMEDLSSSSSSSSVSSSSSSSVSSSSSSSVSSSSSSSVSSSSSSSVSSSSSSSS